MIVASIAAFHPHGENPHAYIEKLMEQATMKAIADGVALDSPQMLALRLAARQQGLDEEKAHEARAVQAMADVVQACLAEGVKPNSPEMTERQLAAYRAVMGE